VQQVVDGVDHADVRSFADVTDAANLECNAANPTIRHASDIT
jgi:hypothetical protein